MQYTEIMVRYGELSTKGKNRRNFIDRLGFCVGSVVGGAGEYGVVDFLISCEKRCLRLVRSEEHTSELQSRI